MSNPPKPAPAVNADDGPIIIDSVRPSYYDEVQERALIFGRDLLTLIPELESVAIVPAYKHPTDDIPQGILVGRQGAPKTAIEVMHLSSQMHRTQFHLLRHAGEFLKYVDQETASAISQLHEKREELKQLDAELAKRTGAAPPEQPAGGGAAPSSAGPGEHPEVGPAPDR